jgi:hypothetical protein
MTSKTTVWLMASAIALSTAAPVLAQSADAAYQQRLQTYGDQRAAYDERSADYRAQQQAYEADRAKYDRARADYDRRYGSGAYDRRYPQYATRFDSAGYANSSDYRREQASFDHDRQVYEDTRRDYDRRNGYGAYDRRYPDQARRFSVSGQVYTAQAAATI